MPGADAAAAELKYHKLQQDDEKYVYHGRVVRQNGWVILQYWFFMAFNSWRSGFDGVNDHESDWEMALVYLYEEDGQLVPEWVAYASHDFHGADLRRRWDDREQLDLIDGHPVIYAGAGSHASYFRRGEYQADMSLPVPLLLRKLVKAWRHLWVDVLGQEDSGGSILRAPFVDYARGDGVSVGPGQQKEWTPVLISEETPWVSQYQGMWGLWARDPLSGENAPAGPMYNRDGTPRSSWFDPLGFSALDKVPPPPHELQMLEARCREATARRDDLAAELNAKAAELQAAGVELQAIQRSPHLIKYQKTCEQRLAESAKDVTALRREQALNEQQLAAFNDRIAQLRAGIKDPPQAHLRHMALPVPPAAQNINRAIETWASLSISLMLVAIAALLWFAPQYVWIGTVLLVTVFVLFEAVLRGRFVAMVGTVTTVLALVTAVILFFTYLDVVVIGGLVALALVLMAQKLRELRT